MACVARHLCGADYGKASGFIELAMDYRVGAGLVTGTGILYSAVGRDVARYAERITRNQHQD
jgi:hypothetical protein